jgi:homoserine kinase type II
LLQLFRHAAPLSLTEIERSVKATVPLQVCLRDVWSAHVLFTGNRVTGLIDFDALKVDSVATDIARLLGSYASDNTELWSEGVLAYHQVRPLSVAEREAIAVYDLSAVLLTGLQWLEWILLEGRDFEASHVLPRLDATIGRLEHLSQCLRTTGSALDRG